MSAVVKQAIAGVVPPELGEGTVMTVWPSVAISPIGQVLGRLYSLGSSAGFFAVGKLFALASIPVAIVLYFLNVAPVVGLRYCLTNRRVLVLHGVKGSAGQYVDLDRFDAIEIDVRPGQEWYKAGDLVFRRGPTEVLRLRGVSRPEAFRQVCLKAHQSYVGVKKSQHAMA